MKNKGRRHKAGNNADMHGICNCKGDLTPMTRPVKQMGPGAMAEHLKGTSKKFVKKKWSKRKRQYFKKQDKEQNYEKI